jgi:photosystem II stability/assembly factor-like uncharacterized protein
MTDSLERFLQDFRFDVPPGLVERAKAAAAVDPATVPQAGHQRVRTRGDFVAQRLNSAPALVAILLAIAIVATLLVASRTLRPHIVPVQTPPVPPVGSACSSSMVLKDEPVDREPRGFLHMITATIGWRDGVYSAPAPARTTDGGISWQPVAPWPVVVGPYKGVQAYLASCFLDANHAWVTERTESMPIEVDHLLVFRTTDGGQTWQQSAAISIGAAEIIRTELLTFIDDQHGWLFTEFQTGASNLGIRTVFATTDGGLRWIQVARATETDHTVLGGLNAGCSETGMNFVSADTGWLTWDCYSHYANGGLDLGVTPAIAITDDAGRSWQKVSLGYPVDPEVMGCGATPPTFSGNQGVLPVTCRAGITAKGWHSVFTSSDAGRTWTFHRAPFMQYGSFFGGTCCPEDFIDANVGWAFVGRGGIRSGPFDLYETTNGGRDWAVVSKGVFSGEDVEAYQFLGGGIGFVYTSSMNRQGSPWKTTNGGKTWSR